MGGVADAQESGPPPLAQTIDFDRQGLIDPALQIHRYDQEGRARNVRTSCGRTRVLLLFNWSNCPFRIKYRTAVIVTMISTIILP